MKKLRTILAVALVLCLMAGLVPMAAFADDANIEENAGDTGSAVAEAVGSPAGDTSSGNVGNAGDTGTQAAGSPAGDTVSGNSGNGGSTNVPSENSGDAGTAANSAADNNTADNNTAGNDAADNAAPAENSSDSGMPQAPEAFTGNAPEAPVAPVEPDLTGLSDEAANEKIRAYNEEVARYNEAVEQYNTAFEAYEAAAAEYNASVENFNDSAASYNVKVDEHNQAEQKKLDDYHAAMEDYNQKASPIIERQQKIDAISEKNMAKAEGQMKDLGDISRLDKEKILSLGTVLEEDYIMDYGWRTSTLGHAGDLVISWKDLEPQDKHLTIRVQEGVKSNETYKVANLHIFEDFADFNERDDYMSERGWDCMNINVDDTKGVIIIPKALIDHIAMIEIDVAEVDKNDTVTVLGQNNIFTSNYVTTVGRFFEGYSDGPYWLSAGTIFQSTAADSEPDWTGTSHTFSYSNGTTDWDDIKNPLNVNHYVFQRYGNKLLPEKPEEVTADMMDKAEPLSFIQILGAKLSRLLGLPEREIKAKEDPAPVVPVDPVVPVIPVIPEVAEIPDEVTPLAEPEQKDEEPAVIPVPVDAATEKIDAQLSTLVHNELEEEIADDETPLASGATWALVNLIASLLTVLLAMVSLVNRRVKEDESDEKETRISLSVVIPAAVSVILFILTEDMRNPMVIVDIWTPLMLLILAGGCMLDLFVARRDRQENKSKTEISG